MAYHMVYLRIRSNGYNVGWTSDTDQTAFKEESRRIFQELGWTLKTGSNGVCDTITIGHQDLYLHPTSFSGVLDEANIQPLQEQLSKALIFQCYHADRYEEYLDWSDEEYRAALEAKRGKITDIILEQCRIKRSNLYITDPVAACVAEEFEVCRLCDKDRNNGVGKQFMADRFGYGGRRISSELIAKGIRNERTGDHFHYSSIQNILRNIMYVGIVAFGCVIGYNGFKQMRGGYRNEAFYRDPVERRHPEQPFRGSDLS